MEGGFTDQLRLANYATWDKIINHEWTDRLAFGSLSDSQMSTYLLQDYLFLDAFVVLLSSMISKARCLDDRIPGAQFLGLITSSENTYFVDSLAHYNVAPGATPKPVTQSFIDLMLEASEGTLAECLAVLTVCEWSYCCWGTRVAPNSKVSDQPHFQRWIDLHSGEGFENLVAYLRGLLDKEGEVIGADEKERVGKLFEQAVELEL
eukprot:CAMPEP_0118650874 /NCGR_PEP_ID=MMETSP0785-20121206/10479_1 /TAXON_ID=91992 /ORGANISM="Bolidomonas pacifica, Strain CCMP 1866" /LENGTH=205 /DNA_ID=CAMNT_0006543277 /DNA_START=218 /DNA_END=831 /DNA_ORIENTATION=+